MTFASTWSNLLAECEALEDDATLITPLSKQRFRITDVQEHRVIVEFVDSEESRPLQREQGVSRPRDGILRCPLCGDTPGALTLGRGVE